MPNVKFIRDIIYTLKNDYPSEITYVQIQRSAVDMKTGQSTVTKKQYRIKKAVLLPTKLQRQFVQDIAYLAANKNFTYGALFDSNKSVYIIDRRDLPRDVEINLNDYIITKHKRFVIDSADILEHNCGWVLVVKNHEGSFPFETHQLSIRHSTQFSQEITNA